MSRRWEDWRWSAPRVARDSIFRIASTTKPITAAATLAVAAEGLIGLDDPVDGLLPELADRRVLRRIDGPLEDTVPAARAITARDLLTSRSGSACWARCSPRPRRGRSWRPPVRCGWRRSARPIRPCRRTALEPPAPQAAQLLAALRATSTTPTGSSASWPARSPSPNSSPGNIQRILAVSTAA